MAALGADDVEANEAQADTTRAPSAVDTPPSTNAPTTEAPAATTTIAPRDTPLETPPSTKVPTTEAPTAPTTIAPTVTVTVIVDGDTVEISAGERVRLVGIDTPERGTGDCASKATARLTELVLGHPVGLVAGARDDEDRYGRLLRYVDAEVDAGYQLIVEGLAITRYDSRDGYGRHAREPEYVQADAASPDCINAPLPTPPPAPGPAPAPTPGNVSYENCDAVRAAGAAPLYAGQPGYAPKLDRDGDGIACE